MTTAVSTPITSQRAVATAVAFFDAYGRRDVNAMVDMCSDNADFEYVPFELWGRQRVMRGAGKVATIGKAMWTGFITSFPDMTNTVSSTDADQDGNVIVEATLSGTQSGPWGTISNLGRRFSEPHLFVIHVDDEAKIDSITAYWDCASVSRQLGHLEVD